VTRGGAKAAQQVEGQPRSPALSHSRISSQRCGDRTPFHYRTSWQE
jgi:hypothetical protein